MKTGKSLGDADFWIGHLENLMTCRTNDVMSDSVSPARNAYWKELPRLVLQTGDNPVYLYQTENSVGKATCQN